MRRYKPQPVVPIPLDPRIVARIEAIDWFAHCGEPLGDLDDGRIAPVASWERAMEFCSDQTWEDTTLEARNALAGHVFHASRERYNTEWSERGVSAKELFSRVILAKLARFQQQHSLREQVLGDVRWCVGHAIQEDAFADTDPPIRFFSWLLDLYERGRFPCGWVDGDWPEGRLVLF